MKTLVILVMLCLFVISGCSPKMMTVSSGEKVVCSECGKIIRSDIVTKQVPESEVSNYSVRETKEICSDCQVKIESRRQKELVRTILGSWVYHWSMCDVMLHIRSDGKGDFNDCQMTWQFVAEGIKGTYQMPNGYGHVETIRFTARLTPTGRIEFHHINIPSGWLMGRDLIFERA